MKTYAYPSSLILDQIKLDKLQLMRRHILSPKSKYDICANLRKNAQVIVQSL